MVLPLVLAGQVTTTWEGGTTGVYGLDGNWSEDAPGGDDTARFLDAGEVAVTFNGNAEVAFLVFQGTPFAGPPVVDPKLTFMLGANEYIHNNSMRFNYTGAGTMTFVQNGGTLDVNGSFGLAWGSLGDGGSIIPVATSRSVMIVEDGGTLKASGFALGYTGGATGELHVVGGSRAEAADTIWVGRTGTGVLRLHGAGTEMIQNTDVAGRQIAIGHTGGTGTLEILAGAKLTTSRMTNLAQNQNSSGSLLVSGSDSQLTSTGPLYVGGYAISNTAAPTAGGVGLATFADGATATFNVLRTLANSPALNRIGTVEFNQSGGVVVNDATFDPDSVVRFALHADNQSVDLMVVDNLVIGGAILQAYLAPLFEPLVGNSFALIGYGTLVPGTFANADGQVVIDDMVFAIDYSLGGADVIGLTLIPEPGMSALALGLLAVILILRRRRSTSRS